MAKEISKEFSLKPEEQVVKSFEKVGYGNGPFSENNDLILTNQALCHIKKNLFGKVTEVVRHPLSDIVVSGGRPQVVNNPINSVNASCDVYLTYGIEKFRFHFGDEAEEVRASIVETMTGVKEQRKSMFDDLGGLENLAQMADTVSSSATALRKAFGIKSDEQGTCKCSSCGASLSGTEDEVVVCPFCGTHNKIIIGK